MTEPATDRFSLSQNSPANEWIERQTQKGPMSSEDVIHAMLPLLDQVVAIHEQGLVAPLEGLQHVTVTNGQFWFSNTDAKKPVYNNLHLERIDQRQRSAIEVQNEYKVDEIEGVHFQDKRFAKPGDKITAPVYLSGWVTWEQESDHHDELSDIFICGLMMASLATGLYLNDDQELQEFIEAKGNLFVFNKQLHPVLIKLISKMCELSRHSRIQDLPATVHALRNYRVQQIDDTQEELLGELDNSDTNKRARVLSTLQERLFDISRRNRMLYFKSSLGMVNMTESSIPLMMSPEHIRAQDLFIWQDHISKPISQGKPLVLGEHLRFEDAPYLPGVLDRLRAEDRRSRREYGFSMLRLALVFLRWHNLRENKEERIHSPLLILPVRLDKKKGVRDAYTLTPLSNEAEVNPVLRHHLQELYGLRLPEFIDLEKEDPYELHKELERQILASEPGITLRCVEKPKIDLIHRRAKKRVEVFRRRSRLTGRGIRRLGDIDYSYNKSNYRPLGLQIFLKRIKAPDWPLGQIANSKPKPRMPQMASNPDVIENTTYNMSTDEENPYVWDVDYCSIILGNFNSRKMSLVRDYRQLIDEPELHTPVFEELFTARPKENEHHDVPPLAWRERYDVVAADPTQAQAVAAARAGHSFIIQGPPGTGKSQVITNLIADAVANHKRVLFVCEKRAALDVVYHRLEQHGLHRLSSLIHDAQDDKKSFLQDLKNTYEQMIGNPDTCDADAARREGIADDLQRGIELIGRWGEILRQSQEQGITPLGCIRRLIALDGLLPEFSEREAEEFPSWVMWQAHAKPLRELEALLRELNEPDVFGKHPLRLLNQECLLADRMLQHVESLIKTALERAQDCAASLNQLGQGVGDNLSVEETRDLLAYAHRISDLSTHKLHKLLDPSDQSVGALEQLHKERQHLQAALDKADKEIVHWKQRLGAHEISDIIDLAVRVEGAWYRFLLPKFWNLKKIMNAHYDFSKHNLQPQWSRLLNELKGYYQAADNLSDHDKHFEIDYLPGNATELLERVQALHAAQDQLSPSLKALRDLLINDEQGRACVTSLVAARPLFDEMTGALSSLLSFSDGLDISSIPQRLSELDSALAILPDVSSVLAQFAQGDPQLYKLAVSTDWSSDRIEAAIVRHCLNSYYRTQRNLTRVNYQQLIQQVERLNSNLDSFRDANGEAIFSKLHQHFRAQIAKSSQADAQLDMDQRKWKKAYNRGRKELEHEFNKVMRHKSIRSLAADETGMVVNDLKPIWLMSPLSVSDTIPMDTRAFDVVIFDEASQIALEESIPTLFRSTQSIVVGDEQQLPPTNFFGSKSNSKDEEEIDADDDMQAALGLDADSFLSHAALTLSATMLGWHYRSRSEQLIAFSNAGFYARQLMTIPDNQLFQNWQNIEITDKEQAMLHAKSVVERPVSFHYLPNGVYHKRCNVDEAEYIARLTLQLLRDNPEYSIGIVAFSEAQSDQIEHAVQQICNDDSEAASLFDRAYDREDDDQFMGLFIKNLENVQGDERDIIILSVCYGYDSDRKMRMNFGPINNSGGEKRLNVVFSRARHHMVMVSSIQYHAITNDYNDGANCLKRYLRFAEASSRGDAMTAERVLEESCPESSELLARQPSRDPVIRSICQWLQQQGFMVDEQVGSSRFRCDIGVRNKNGSRYALGILVDTDQHYENADILEQYVMRPGILEAFGWPLTRVLGRDWLEEREVVQGRILRMLE